ncbi:protein qui-1-like [Liolophura sinensis]|uniref:protein qui-1-like n=1 Tax=Liolophura sinensis TaxID=3198878 RepID=UPI0031595868
MPAHHFQPPKRHSDVISGRLGGLPQPPSKTVKIYVCSNKSDFELERQTLWSQALPELHLCCLHYGLDLQLVDVHQGSDLDHVLDGYVFEQHLSELQESSQISVGPFFLCLLGDKYGKPPLPTYLEETEFVHIRSEAFEGGKDVKLLDNWYKKDENAVPPVYKLVPISQRFKHVNSRDPELQAVRDCEVSDWREIYTQLLELLQHGAREAFREGLINQVHHLKQDRFFLSGIEQELQKALEKSVRGCVCIMRKMEGLEPSDACAEIFTDIEKDGELNLEGQKGIRNMREFVSAKFNDKNKHTFTIPWSAEGLVPHFLDSHYDYLDDFNAAVITKLKLLIEQAAKFSPTPSSLMCYPPRDLNEGLKEQVSWEALPHLYHCVRLGTAFVSDGFECELEDLRKALTAGACVDHKAVVMYGPESSGKSSLLAHCAWRLIPETLGKDVIVVARFLDSVRPMAMQCHLQSVSQQIFSLLGVDVDFLSHDKDQLSASYQNLLQCLSQLSRQLVIILDGLTAVHGDGGLEEGYSWLACRLPPRVHILVSFTETSAKSSPNRTVQNNKHTVVVVKKKTKEQLLSCFLGMLAKDKRTLAPEQENVLKNSMTSQCMRRLALLAYQAKQCMSWDSIYDKCLCTEESFQESVMKLFEVMEKRHGVIFVSQIARYLTLARAGLTEMELLDLLSISNDILLAAYPQELPPILRFPVSLWIAIKTDLNVLLMPCFLDNKQVYCWCHHSINSVVRQRYLYHQQPRMARESHKQIAELFLESWIDNKPLVDKDRNVQRIHCGNRLLSPQPLLYSETRYNMRRINEMWHHLLHAGEQDSFREYAYCSFEYLLATAHSTSIKTLLTNLENSHRLLLDAEINLVLSSIKLSIEVLTEDPLQLANELIGRLRQLKEFYPQTIDSLVTECMQWCDSYSLPLIVPLTPWLPDPRNPLITSLEVSDGITKVLPTQNSQHILCATEKNVISMYHVPSRKLVTTFSGHAGVVLCLTLSSNHKRLFSGADDGTIRLWDVFTGDCVEVIREHDSAVMCMTLSQDGKVLVSGSRDKSVLVYNLLEGKVSHRLREHTSTVTAVTFNSTGTILITASFDKRMILWYVEDMTVLNCISQDITSPILCMTLSIDNTFLLIGCEDGSVHVFSFTTGTEVHQLKGHKGKVSSLAVGQDCVHAVLGCDNGGVYIYNLCTTELLRTFMGIHKSCVISVRISRDQNMIFSASRTQVCVWNMYKEATREVVDDSHPSPVTAVAINSTGKLAVTGSKDGILKLWNLDLSVFMENLSGHTNAITCLTLAEEEAYILSGSADNTIKVWSISMGTIVTDYQCHQGPIKSVHVLSDSLKVMSVDASEKLKLWMVDTGQTLFSYADPIPIMALSHSSEYVFSLAGSSSLKIWKLEDSNVIQTISHKGNITCVACTEDSEHVVTGSDDMSLKVWETRTGKLTQVLVGHQGSVNCVTTTHNSCNIISGSRDRSIIIWNLGTGTVEHQLEGHKGVISVLRVTTDGSILVSGSWDGTLRVWSLLHGSQLTLFDMHADVEDIAMTFNASNIVVHLSNNCHVPLMCLHNTPAAEVKSQSQVSIQMVNSLAGDYLPLPLKPHPPLVHCPSTVFPERKEVKLKRRESRFSVSSMPEIIQVSPIKAPVKTAIMAQERKREKKLKTKKIERKQSKKEEKNKSKSEICCVL